MWHRIEHRGHLPERWWFRRLPRRLHRWLFIRWARWQVRHDNVASIEIVDEDGAVYERWRPDAS